MFSLRTAPLQLHGFRRVARIAPGYLGEFGARSTAWTTLVTAFESSSVALSSIRLTIAFRLGPANDDWERPH